MPSSIDLLDAEVWLALIAEAEPRHAPAVEYWEKEAAAMMAFCRLTQIEFLSRLSRVEVMGPSALSPAAAWSKQEQLLALPEVGFLDEPPGFESYLANLVRLAGLTSGAWNYLYLAAFGLAAGARLITFDSGYASFPGLKVLVLRPNPQPKANR
jgi:predicted nucleic acid-binding protein